MHAQVLKAKYSANTNVLEAIPMVGMSYCWRSILQEVELVKEGMIWQVGDGDNLNNWKDPWIPRHFSRTSMTPRGANLITRVSELIDLVVLFWWLGQCFGKGDLLALGHRADLGLVCARREGEHLGLAL